MRKDDAVPQPLLTPTMLIETPRRSLARICREQNQNKPPCNNHQSHPTRPSEKAAVLAPSASPGGLADVLRRAVVSRRRGRVHSGYLALLPGHHADSEGTRR